MAMRSTAQSGRSDDASSTFVITKQQNQLSSLHIITTEKKYDVCGKDVSKALKMAATLLEYPETRGIPIELIDTHSLQTGGANALSLSGYSDTQIQKMGRWRGAMFKEYIREQLACYSKGMTTNMKCNFKFVNVHGNAYHDITSTCILTEYKL
jgi:hypothetical protein